VDFLVIVWRFLLVVWRLLLGVCCEDFGCFSGCLRVLLIVRGVAAGVDLLLFCGGERFFW
jgi:hypothetical protein